MLPLGLCVVLADRMVAFGWLVGFALVGYMGTGGSIGGVDMGRIDKVWVGD